MFARVKKSGKYQYLQIVENRKEKGKVKQRVIATIGRMDQLQAKGRVETLIRSLSRFSERVMLILSGNSEVLADAKKIGPALIFERLWQRTGIKTAINRMLADRAFEFDVERAIFLTVLHRLMVSGSDRYCERWRSDYVIDGVDKLDLHHLYRAMGFLGEELADQKKASSFAPRCIKDAIEEHIFYQRKDLFTELDLVFFDTTSIYFEGKGGQSLGQRGFSKDHRPDLKQMIVGVVAQDIENHPHEKLLQVLRHIRCRQNLSHLNGDVLVAAGIDPVGGQQGGGRCGAADIFQAARRGPCGGYSRGCS